MCQVGEKKKVTGAVADKVRHRVRNRFLFPLFSIITFSETPAGQAPCCKSCAERFGPSCSLKASIAPTSRRQTSRSQTVGPFVRRT